MNVMRDFRQGCRSLLAQPAWTIAALICLAIGTGANTAAFSVINGILLRSLPFEEPEQIVLIAVRGPKQEAPGPVSLEQFREMGDARSLFQQLAVRTFMPVAVADGASPARMTQAEFVSPSYFALLRLRPLVGTFLDAKAEMGNSGLQAVISEKLWRTRFQGDAAIAGKSIRVNGQAVVIAGVAPRGFSGVMQLLAADVWMPVSAYGSFAAPGAVREAESRREFGLVGRMKPGTTIELIRQQLTAMLREEEGIPAQSPGVLVEEAKGFGVPPALLPIVKGASVLLFGLMWMLIAVAVANVAGLMLARATGRAKDMAIRLALGAGAGQIVRQVMVESLILAGVGTLLGAALAASLPTIITILSPTLPEYLEFGVDVRMDWRSGVYAGLSAIAIAVLFGLAPARQAAGTGAMLALRESAGNSRTRRTARILNGFVIAQIAISTTLLVVSVLLARTYWHTQAVDPGIDIRNIVAVTIDWRQSGAEASGGRVFFTQLLERVAAIAGVDQAALVEHPPLGGAMGGVAVEAEGISRFTAGTTAVTPGYFRTVRLEVLRGRGFNSWDDGARAVAMVNETMARLLAPGGDAVGRTFMAGGWSGRRMEVVGVVRDTKHRSLSEGTRAFFYEPFGQRYSAQMTLLARGEADPTRMSDAIRREMTAQNENLAAVNVRTLADQFAAAAAPSRQRALLLAIICGTGLLLSAFGLFGAVSYGVRQRARELGIRAAIGAHPAAILRMVLGDAMKLAGLGCAIGLALALAAGRLLSNVLFGVSAHDPLTLVSVIALLAFVCAAAAFFPARWAARADPLTAIRAE